MIFTIGHSNHTQDFVVSLLQRHGVTAVCDVRSRPYSRMNPQFNREDLRDALRAAAIEYIFLGEELGARSEDPASYEKGQVRYGRLAETVLFQKGLDRVCTGAGEFRIALMCAEKEPLDCHRTILVARHLADRGFEIQHIHGDGHLESHADAVERLLRQFNLHEAELFRSPAERVDDAYRLQEQRIAWSPDAVNETQFGRHAGIAAG